MADVTSTEPEPNRATPIVALDFWMPDAALQMVDLLGDRCDFYKVGSELFTVAGPPIVRQLVARGKRVFLDLKFHDIPNTVEKAVAAAAELGASILTVHASGGERMIRAAVGNAGAHCQVFAVTVLTSLSGAEIDDLWGGGTRADLNADVLRLAVVAARAGVAGTDRTFRPLPLSGAAAKAAPHAADVAPVELCGVLHRRGVHPAGPLHLAHRLDTPCPA